MQTRKDNEKVGLEEKKYEHDKAPRKESQGWQTWRILKSYPEATGSSGQRRKNQEYLQTHFPRGSADVPGFPFLFLSVPRVDIFRYAYEDSVRTYGSEFTPSLPGLLRKAKDFEQPVKT